jgi:hypothetical protein
MRKKRFLSLGMVVISAMLLGAFGHARADTASPFSPVKVGDEAFSFTLPSSQGKLVDYYKDYYGKHHLVMTFFPAAFTPI